MPRLGHQQHKQLPRGLRPLAPDEPCRTNQPVTRTVYEPVRLSTVHDVPRPNKIPPFG